MAKICVILLVVMAACHSAKSLKCYYCLNCALDQPTEIKCSDTQLCASIAYYNSVGNFTHVNRRCMAPEPSTCVDGQTKCIGRNSGDCFRCCSSDGCNKDTRPSSTDKDNNAVSLKTGSVMMLSVLLVLLALMY